MRFEVAKETADILYSILRIRGGKFLKPLLFSASCEQELD